MLVRDLSIGDLFQFRRQRLPDIYEVMHVGTRPLLGYRLAGHYRLGKVVLLPDDQRGNVQTWSPDPDLTTNPRVHKLPLLSVDKVVL